MAEPVPEASMPRVTTSAVLETEIPLVVGLVVSGEGGYRRLVGIGGRGLVGVDHGSLEGASSVDEEESRAMDVATGAEVVERAASPLPEAGGEDVRSFPENPARRRGVVPFVPKKKKFFGSSSGRSPPRRRLGPRETWKEVGEEVTKEWVSESEVESECS